MAAPRAVRCPASPDLAAGPLGANPEVLNWRLWDLINAGVVSQSPTGYELTPRGENLRTLLAEADRGDPGSNPGHW